MAIKALLHSSLPNKNAWYTCSKDFKSFIRRSRLSQDEDEELELPRGKAFSKTHSQFEIKIRRKASEKEKTLK